MKNKEFFIKISSRLPLEDEEIYQTWISIYSESENILSNYTFSQEKLIKAKKMFKERHFPKIETIKFDNHLKSKSFCSLICNKLIETIEKPSLSEKEKNIQFPFLHKQVLNLCKIYCEEAKGPSKFEIFSSNFLEAVLRGIDRLINNQKIDFEE